MEKYKHTVHYYETDRMGFTHHSNYVRWIILTSSSVRFTILFYIPQIAVPQILHIAEKRLA